MAFPGRYCSLDSLAIAKGQPWDGFMAFAVERQRMRLRRKEQQALTVGWSAGASSSGGGRSLPIQPFWEQIVESIHFEKAAVALRAQVQLSFMQSAPRMALQFATKARPFDPALPVTESDTVTQIDATVDTFAVSSVKTIPLLEGEAEEISIYARLAEIVANAATGAAPTWEFRPDHVYDATGAAAFTVDQFVGQSIELLAGTAVVHQARVARNGATWIQFFPRVDWSLINDPWGQRPDTIADSWRVLNRRELAVLGLNVTALREAA